ncbi:hypothetical protein FRX31_030208 [Thalictrum thalictroides]|uniref:Uncharacterized protein n=1 Tax=Thalictrum thalictroides TaxID=46969 RepID=A0A7J6V559_THATH|nr:hypothetical protein FRX31_030208 [Thalictrum thalictroides]
MLLITRSCWENICLNMTYKPVKVNSDGALNDTRGSYGGIIRDHLGRVCLAYAGSSNHKSVLCQDMN